MHVLVQLGRGRVGVENGIEGKLRNPGGEDGFQLANQAAVLIRTDVERARFDSFEQAAEGDQRFETGLEGVGALRCHVSVLDPERAGRCRSAEAGRHEFKPSRRRAPC